VFTPEMLDDIITRVGKPLVRADRDALKRDLDAFAEWFATPPFMPNTRPPHELRKHYERISKLAGLLRKELSAVPQFWLVRAADRHGSRVVSAGADKAFIGLTPERILDPNSGLDWVDVKYNLFVERVLSDIAALEPVAGLAAKLVMGVDPGPISRLEFPLPSAPPLPPRPKHAIAPHVAWLAVIFEEHTRRRAGVSNTPDGQRGGAFIQFVEAVFTYVGVRHGTAAYSSGTIANALDEAKKGWLLEYTKLRLKKS
jgi:hypothetical protein